MKKFLLLIIMCIATISFADEAEIDAKALSKTLGHLIVRHLVHPGIEMDLDLLIQGIEDERKGIASPMTEEEYEQTIVAVQEKVFLETSEKNLQDAVAFLEENAQQEDILSLEEKLQYRLEHKGEGAVVTEDSAPLIHYKGTLLDGTVFAASKEGAEPIMLPIKQSIPGFAKGLVGMKEGEKRTLYIHPELAYGTTGHLPPNSLLIFEVEIVKANGLEQEPLAEASGEMPDSA